MSDDLVNRLLNYAQHAMPNFPTDICSLAASTIEAKDAEIERLRTSGRKAIDAGEVIIGTLRSELKAAESRAEQAERALNREQDNTYASFDKWSKALGWGLTGNQPECWALMDSAVEELVSKRRALAEAVIWRTFADTPEIGRKFIALYNDGSGAEMFFAIEGGVIDSDGDELYGWFSADHSYDRWAYLPDNLEFWCEVRAEDPMTLKIVAQHGSDSREGRE